MLVLHLVLPYPSTLVYKCLMLRCYITCCTDFETNTNAVSMTLKAYTPIYMLKMTRALALNAVLLDDFVVKLHRLLFFIIFARQIPLNSPTKFFALFAHNNFSHTKYSFWYVILFVKSETHYTDAMRYNATNRCSVHTYMMQHEATQPNMM